jgi:hypothetical protein
MAHLLGQQVPLRSCAAYKSLVLPSSSFASHKASPTRLQRHQLWAYNFAVRRKMAKGRRSKGGGGGGEMG